MFKVGEIYNFTGNVSKSIREYVTPDGIVLAHRSGEACEVDWSQKDMKLVDRDIGEVFKVFLFLGSLFYSQYSYEEHALTARSVLGSAATFICMFS